METLGLRAPQPPVPPETVQLAQEQLKSLPRSVTLRVHAGETLNTDSEGRPLSLLVRIYTLKNGSAFLSAAYDSFMQAAKEKEALGDDLISVREVLLVPGQKFETQERVPREAGYIGVVALFRAPAVQRWRFAFAADGAVQSGLVLGAHACALSVGIGQPVGALNSIHVSPSLLGTTTCS